MPDNKNNTEKNLETEQEKEQKAEQVNEEPAKEAEKEEAKAAQDVTENANDEPKDADQKPNEKTSDAEVNDTAEEKEAGNEAKGKRFWQKQPKAAKKDKRDEQIAELHEKITRQLAEFDNFRKRTEKEKAQNYMIGARDVLEKMLPIIDNFERGFANADMEDPFTQGMEKVYRQMTTALESLGVTPMNAKGQEFNPSYHNAVMHVDDETVGANVIVEELQKGYMYKDTVLRYAMVKVAN